MYIKKTSYDYLYLFRDIMRCGSYQKAAKEAGCTVASIAKKIAQMETELGFSVFEKDSGGMVPTATGLFLYDKLDSYLWNLDAMLQQAKNIPPEKTMKLTFGISDMIAGKFYRQFIQSFAVNHPGISFSMAALSASELRRKLTDGRVDMALTYSVGLLDEPGLERVPLYRGKPCIYYHKQMPVGDLEKEGIEALRNCTFACLNTDVAALDVLRVLPFEPEKVIFADTLKSIYLYVNAGLACAVMGPTQQMSESSDIVCFEVENADHGRGLDLVWVKSNTNPAIRLMADCAEKVYGLGEKRKDQTSF